MQLPSPRRPLAPVLAPLALTALATLAAAGPDTTSVVTVVPTDIDALPYVISQ